jgi:two-component system, LuxR family, sensor kinase FixL
MHTHSPDRPAKIAKPPPSGVSIPVVVVDDEPMIVSVILDILRFMKIEASACPHGDQVLACIREKRPRVLLLDIQMPGMDGIEIFQRLRADPETATISVIFVTANASRLLTWFPQYQQMGASVLSKPFDFNQLIDLVHEGLKT